MCVCTWVHSRKSSIHMLNNIAKIFKYHLVWFVSEILSHGLTFEQLASHCGTILYYSFWQNDELNQPEHSSTMNSSGFNTAPIFPLKLYPAAWIKPYWVDICSAMNALLNDFSFWYVRTGIVFGWHQTEATFQHCVAEMLYQA